MSRVLGKIKSNWRVKIRKEKDAILAVINKNKPNKVRRQEIADVVGISVRSVNNRLYQMRLNGELAKPSDSDDLVMIRTSPNEPNYRITLSGAKPEIIKRAEDLIYFLTQLNEI